MNETLGQIAALPESSAALLVTVLAAALAAAGYVAKLLIELVRAGFDRRDARRARLVELDSLLRASRAVFAGQRELADRLYGSIAERLGAEPPPEATLDHIFTATHEHMAPTERALHGLIRSMTENAMKPLNEATLAWLRADTFFKAQRGGSRGALAAKLSALEAHLHMWLAKYEYWLKDQRHALVYMVDEARHGVGFPEGLDAAVAEELGLPST